MENKIEQDWKIGRARIGGGGDGRGQVAVFRFVLSG